MFIPSIIKTIADLSPRIADLLQSPFASIAESLILGVLEGALGTPESVLSALISDLGLKDKLAKIEADHEVAFGYMHSVLKDLGW